MKRIPIILIAFFTINGLQAASLDDFFSNADTFFKKHVRNGLVDYKNIKTNYREIEDLYAAVRNLNIASASNIEKKAFYINAYNLIVIYQVTKSYPLKSPLDQSGFFDQVKHTVAGEPMTLNYLEKTKLINEYKDPRLHFALACAAKSCPQLANYAFKPADLDAELTLRTKRAINDKTWLIIKPVERKIELSQIFKWYENDFTMDGKSEILEFINKYRGVAIPETFEVGYYEYDWSLNEG